MSTSTCYITITHATPSSVSTLVKTKSWVGCVSVALVSTHPAQKLKNNIETQIIQQVHTMW